MRQGAEGAKGGKGAKAVQGAKGARVLPGDRDPIPFLFIPASHGPAYWIVHVPTCKDARKDWSLNNSSGRRSWDKDDLCEGRTAEEAVNDHISDLVAGGHEPGAFQPSDYHVNACCKV